MLDFLKALAAGLLGCWEQAFRKTLGRRVSLFEITPVQGYLAHKKTPLPP